MSNTGGPNVNYFGYGANQSHDLMAAVIGRNPHNWLPAVLRGYELVVHSWQEIPIGVQELLKTSGWDPEYRVYAIRPNERSSVHGSVYEITKAERELLSNWQMNGILFEPISVEVEVVGKHTLYRAETEMINNPAIGRVVGGILNNSFLNDKTRMLEAAQRDRKTFLRDQQTPNPERGN